jgi:hypothetical protein
LIFRDAQQPLNQRVQGSSPCAPTNYINSYTILDRALSCLVAPAGTKLGTNAEFGDAAAFLGAADASRRSLDFKSTAQFLDWFKRPFPGQNMFELMRMQAEKLLQRTRTWVRLRAPSGVGAVQTFSGRHINIGPDGTVEMSAEDAEYLIRAGWTKLAEWSSEEAA